MNLFFSASRKERTKSFNMKAGVCEGGMRGGERQGEGGGIAGGELKESQGLAGISA